MSSSKRDLSFLRYIALTHPKLPKKSVLLHKEAFYRGLEKFLSCGRVYTLSLFPRRFQGRRCRRQYHCEREVKRDPHLGWQRKLKGVGEMNDLHFENIRRDYAKHSLSRKDMPSDPFEKVHQWLQDAVEAKVLEPTAVIVATSTPDGHPSMRTVLLKEVLHNEFIFYSNYESRKGQQMRANPHVALTFLWHELERQIHVEGTVRVLEPELSDAYFDQRPYTSRVGARISPQSHPIPAREFIMTEFAKESLKFLGRKVPRPATWGGFAVKAERIEFWQGRKSRLHDRFLYLPKEDGTWSLTRLAP